MSPKTCLVYPSLTDISVYITIQYTHVQTKIQALGPNQLKENKCEGAKRNKKTRMNMHTSKLIVELQLTKNLQSYKSKPY